MDLSPETVSSLASEYRAVQPLASVEEEHLEILPSTFASGDYGWREAEWVVQWYFRRFLGAYPDADRRAAEAAFGENDYETVHDAIAGAVDADGAQAKLDLLTDLTRVDVSLASAFLQFIEPSTYVVMSPIEWGVLTEADELTARYPDPPSTDAYHRYLTACNRIASRCECDLWTVYTALWRRWYEDSAGEATSPFC